MTKIEKKTILIGFVFILTITLSILGYNYLKGNNPFKPDVYFYAVFDDVNGLTQSAPVFINGVKVGQVTNILIRPDNKVVVQLIIENKYVKIPRGSVAKIFSTDMLGTKAMKIQLAQGSTQFHHQGDTLKTSFEPDLFAILQNSIPKIQLIIDQTSAAIDRLNQLLDQENLQNIALSIQAIKQILYKLDTAIAPNSRLQKIIANLNQTTATLAQNNEQLVAILRNTQQFTDTLASLRLNQSLKQINQLVMQLESILTELQSGKGTMGQLLVNDSLYRRTDSLVRNLNQLLEQWRRNPQKIVEVNLLNFN